MAKKKTSAKKPAGKRKKVTVPKKPRQKALFGEDPGVAEIERAAHDFADVRDTWMETGEEMQRRHTKLVSVMKKYGKRKYLHRTGDQIIDITVSVKDPEDKAKVRIKPVDEYKARPAPGTDEPAAVETETDVVDTQEEVGGREGAAE
jgi:hypothetical protein